MAAVLQARLDAAGSSGAEYGATTAPQRAADFGGGGAAITVQLGGDLRRAQADLDRLHKLCFQQVCSGVQLRRAQTSLI